MDDPIAIEPFTIAADEAALSDLRDRIERTRWSDHVAGSGWAYGTDPDYLRSLLATWADEFDWRSRERELNRLGHYRARRAGQARGREATPATLPPASRQRSPIPTRAGTHVPELDSSLDRGRATPLLRSRSRGAGRREGVVSPGRDGRVRARARRRRPAGRSRRRGGS